MAAPRVIRWIFKDWWLKLLAVLAAALLWFFAKLELQYTREIKLAFDFSRLPNQYVIVTSEVDSVTVEVRAKGKDFINLKVKEARILMPVAGVKEGTERIRIGPENVSLPKQVKVLSLNPYQIELEIERRADRTVQIHVPLEGFPGEGFAISDISYNNPTVNIYGTEEEVGATNQLFSEPLVVEDLKGIKDSSVVYEIPLAVQLPDIAGLVAEPSSVLVKVTIEPEVTKILSNVPVQLKGIPPRGRVYLFDEAAELTLVGPKSLVENLTEDSVQVSISVSSLDTGHREVPASFSLPPVIQVDSCNPKFFHLLIR